jgi:hypothetical protein
MDAPVDRGWCAILVAGVNGYLRITGYVSSWETVKQWALLRLPYEDRKNHFVESRVLGSGVKPKHDSA